MFKYIRELFYKKSVWIICDDSGSARRSHVTGLAREQARKRNGDVLEKSTNALIHIYMNVFIYFLDLIFLDLF